MHVEILIGIIMCLIGGAGILLLSIVMLLRRKKPPQTEPVIEPAAELETFPVYRIVPLTLDSGYRRDTFECHGDCLVYAVNGDADPVGLLSNERQVLHCFGQQPGKVKLNEWDRRPGVRSPEFWTCDPSLAQRIASGAPPRPFPLTRAS
jgi:hypothetical protein